MTAPDRDHCTLFLPGPASARVRAAAREAAPLGRMRRLARRMGHLLSDGVRRHDLERGTGP